MSTPPYAYHQLPPAPPRRRGLSGPIVALLAAIGVLGVLLCGGALYAIGTAGQDDRQGVGAAATSSAPEATTPAPAKTTARPTPSSTPTTAPAAKRVTMPKVTGLNAAIAYERLEKLGFTRITFGSADPDDTVVLWPANWTVTKQSTKPGTKVSTDATVVLTCTKD